MRLVRSRRGPTAAKPVVRGTVALALLLMAALAAGACSSDAASPASTSGAAATTTPSTTTATTADPATTATARPAGRVVEVRVTGGKVQTAERRVSLRRGETVRLQVTADVADEVHVHGYDLKRDTTPGRQAVVEFRADVPGVFEVELEQAKLKLVELQVR